MNISTYRCGHEKLPSNSYYEKNGCGKIVARCRTCKNARVTRDRMKARHRRGKTPAPRLAPSALYLDGLAIARKHRERRAQEVKEAMQRWRAHQAELQAQMKPTQWINFQCSWAPEAA